MTKIPHQKFLSDEWCEDSSCSCELFNEDLRINPRPSLVELLSQQIDEWLTKPPRLVGLNVWLEGLEGKLYIRYNSYWDQLDLATFEIKRKYQKKGISKSLIELAVSKPIKIIKIENILVPKWAQKVAQYNFPGRETVIESSWAGQSTTIKFIKLETNPSQCYHCRGEHAC